MTYLAELSYTRLQEILSGTRTPVLLWPVGSTEPHGPHSPLATDPIISIGIAERVARRLGDDPDLKVLVLPTLSYAVTRYTVGFAGAIHVDEETLKAIVVDVCASLAGQGFPHVVLVNNHFEPEHVQTLHRALDELLPAGLERRRQRHRDPPAPGPHHVGLGRELHRV